MFMPGIKAKLKKVKSAKIKRPPLYGAAFYNQTFFGPISWAL
jgi:hypothetical protein